MKQLTEIKIQNQLCAFEFYRDTGEAHTEASDCSPWANKPKGLIFLSQACCALWEWLMLYNTDIADYDAIKL